MTVTASAARPSIGAGVLATALGGAVGATGRWSVTEALPVAVGHFPWTLLIVNVLGSALLAALPLFRGVRRRTWLPLFLGTGVLGGFTTMSAASTDTFALLDHGDTALGLAYCVGTLAAALLAVLAVDRFSTAAERDAFEAEGGDE